MKYLQSLLVMLTVVLLASTSVHADVPQPNIPKGQGDKCVRPTQDMRVNHMDYILHHRDKTMYDGIRTPTFSFKECINCHVVKDETGKAVNYKDERHFCSTCHSYAAVKIDCFDCHASTPTEKSGSSAYKSMTNPHLNMSASESENK